VNKRDSGDSNALSKAVRRRDKAMVRALLKAKADLAVLDEDCWTAFDRAVQGGKEVMNILLKESPSQEMIEHAFSMAVPYGDEEVIELLVGKVSDLKEDRPCGLCPA
jgi:ankyrin repeat protein